MDAAREAAIGIPPGRRENILLGQGVESVPRSLDMVVPLISGLTTGAQPMFDKVPSRLPRARRAQLGR